MKTMVSAWIVLVLLAGCATSPARRTAMEPTPETPAAYEDASIAYDVGAVAANAFYVPGKAILCVFGTAAGTGIMAVTFGSAYGGAAGFVREGCGGRWVVTGDDIRRETGKRYWRD